MITLDELALRKPEFDEEGSAPIVLRDGQTWHFRKPWIEYTAKVVDGKSMFVAEFTFDELLERFMESDTSIADVYMNLYSLASAMLEPNYNLTPEQIASLTKTRHEHEGDKERWTEIVGVARGIGPKASGDGDESQPSPSPDSPGE